MSQWSHNMESDSLIWNPYFVAINYVTLSKLPSLIHHYFILDTTHRPVVGYNHHHHHH